MGKVKKEQGKGESSSTVPGPSGLSRKQRRKQSRLTKKQNRLAYYSKKSSNAAEHLNKVKNFTDDSRQKSANAKKKRKGNKKLHDEGHQSSKNFKTDLVKANKAEDKIISKLEWKLKLNKKKSLPSAFRNEGLDYLLAACDSIVSDSDVDKIETQKMRKTDNVLKHQKNSSEDDDSEIKDENSSEINDDDFMQQDLDSEEEESIDPDGEDEEYMSDSAIDDDDSVDDNGDDGESLSDEGNHVPEESCNDEEKYVPPQQRKSIDDDSKDIDTIRKRMKGSINRLSESNIGIIINQIENLYRSYSRFVVTETLTQLIFDSCIQITLIPEKLIMEHVIVIAVLHSNVGNEIGAQFIEKLALFYDSLYNEMGPVCTNKKCHNALSLFCQLYNFKIIHCALIYDLIKKSIENMRQLDVELLLHLLRNVGLQIRNDDPTALKEIANQIHSKSGDLVCSTEDASRINFMLETLKYVCNNNSKKIALFDPTILENLRVICRRLCKGSQNDLQLQISLKDLLASDKSGRWWIVGSSWSDRETFGRQDKELSNTGITDNRLIELARKQRMNTDVRRNIFCIIMSSQDYVHAFENLLKLKLKSKQEREIIHVLLDCCLQEKAFNPFYAYLGRKFCEYKRNYQITFKYSIWDRLKRLEDLSENQRQTLSKLLVNLLLSKSLSLSTLKVVNFAEMNEISIKFYRSLLLQLLTDKSEDTCRSIFTRIGSLSHLAELREGLLIFLKHYVLRYLVQSKAIKIDLEMLRRRIELVEREIKIAK